MISDIPFLFVLFSTFPRQDSLISEAEILNLKSLNIHEDASIFWIKNSDIKVKIDKKQITLVFNADF